MKLSEFRVDGLRLAVSEIGDGLPMLFQHGLCGDANQPADVFPQGAGFRCLTLECRGHGSSEAGDLQKLSIAAFTGDVAAFLDESKLGPLVVGGISMGAAIALRLAVRRPDLVRGLVLARPAWTIEAAPANMWPNALVGDLLERFDPAGALELFQHSSVAAELAREAPDNLASLVGFFDRVPQAVTAALLTRISHDGPGVTADEIGAIEVAALVVGHERDHVHPIEHARALARLLPRARFVEITPKAEDRDRYRADFRAALRNFLTELHA